MVEVIACSCECWRKGQGSAAPVQVWFQAACHFRYTMYNHDKNGKEMVKVNKLINMGFCLSFF